MDPIVLLGKIVRLKDKSNLKVSTVFYDGHLCLVQNEGKSFPYMLGICEFGNKKELTRFSKLVLQIIKNETEKD